MSALEEQIRTRALKNLFADIKQKMEGVEKFSRVAGPDFKIKIDETITLRLSTIIPAIRNAMFNATKEEVVKIEIERFVAKISGE